MPYELSRFTLSEMIGLGASLRTLGANGTSLEEVAQRIARFMCEELRDGDRSACVLARCYITHPYGRLPADLQTFAAGLPLGQPPTGQTSCLTLVGTWGDEAAWRSRQGSTGHKAIPLASEAIVNGLPMVAQLTRSLGLEAQEVVRPDPLLLLERERKGFNVFHVPDAADSPFIPAQEGFVKKYGVRSVIGFGFLIPPTGLFAVIMFTRVRVPPHVAELFKTLALSVKLAILPYAAKPLLAGA
jgi:hypothetical protein